MSAAAAAATAATGKLPPAMPPQQPPGTTAGLPPPPQFAPPPPPATASLYSSKPATALVSQHHSNSSSSLQPKKPLQLPQDHQGLGAGPPATANEGRDIPNTSRTALDDDNYDEGEEDADEDGDEDEDQDEPGEDDLEAEGGAGEYVAAVCQYTTILKDAPPGFDNDDYEVNYHNLNNQDNTEDHDNENEAANDHTSPGQHWSSPQINRSGTGAGQQAANFVFSQQKEGFRLRASSAKMQGSDKTSNNSSNNDPVISMKAPRVALGGTSGSSEQSRPTPGRSTSSERIIDSCTGDYNATQTQDPTGMFSTQDESSDVPQAVFIRPPARMRIFQTEVDDDDDDDEDDQDADEEADEDEDDEPPVPPPRSKSKESSLSSRGGGGMRKHGPPTTTETGNDMESRSPNERSVYFDAVDSGVQCNQNQIGAAITDPSSVTSGGGHGPQRRTTPAGQDRSLGSFRESQNVESVEKKEIVPKPLEAFAVSTAACCSSGGTDSCNSRSCSDHSNKKQSQSRSTNRHNRHQSRSSKHSNSATSSREKAASASAAGVAVAAASSSGNGNNASGDRGGGGGSAGSGSDRGQQAGAARRISLDDLSSAFQALISNSSAAVAAAATMSKKSKSTAGGDRGSSRQNSKSLMNRSFVAGSSMASSDCCQSDNSGLGAGDNSSSSAAAVAAIAAAAAAERMRSRSEENLLDSNRSMGRSSHAHHMEERGVSYSPASLKQSNSMRSNDSSLGSSGGGGRFNLVSSRFVLYFY